MTAEVVIGGVAASVSLIDNLVKLLHTARDKGSRLSAAEIIKRLPGEAFIVAKQIAKELEDFRRKLSNAKVDLSLPLSQLESHYEWWKLRRDRIARQALPTINGLTASLLILTDDFIAVAMCAGAEEELASSYAEAAKEKKRIRRIADPDRPVGDILKELIPLVDDLIAELGKL